MTITSQGQVAQVVHNFPTLTAPQDATPQYSEQNKVHHFSLSKPFRAPPHSKQRRHACVMRFQEPPMLFSNINGSLVPKRFIVNFSNRFNGSNLLGNQTTTL